MSKKHSLPESLELLLDTMCNTFGGIMFIAISLIVLSQMATQAQKSMSAEEQNEYAMQQLFESVQRIRNEIVALERKTTEMRSQIKDSTPEKAEKIKQLIELDIKKTELLSELEQKQTGSQTAQAVLARRKKELDKLELSLKTQTILSQQKLDENRQRSLNLKREIASLEEALQAVRPRELRFAKETATSRSPYWVLLRQNKIYRFGIQESPLHGEVETQPINLGRGVRLIPKNGTSLTNAPTEKLDYLFRQVPKNSCFVSLVIDCDSFSTLLVVKQYLRNKGFLVSWSINPNFEFQYSASVRYRASE